MNNYWRKRVTENPSIKYLCEETKRSKIKVMNNIKESDDFLFISVNHEGCDFILNASKEGLIEIHKLIIELSEEIEKTINKEK